MIKLGAFDFLLKPFSLEVVEKSVKRALEYRRRLLESDSSAEQIQATETKDEAVDWKIVKEKGW